jgi:ankyrin repeat protein
MHLDQLHGAIKRGDIVAVREYIRAGGSVSSADDDGWTPLAMAAHSGNTELIRLFLDAGADVNRKGSPKGMDSPLALAAMSGARAAVKLLLARGAKVAAADVELARQLGYPNRTLILELIEEAKDRETSG